MRERFYAYMPLCLYGFCLPYLCFLPNVSVAGGGERLPSGKHGLPLPQERVCLKTRAFRGFRPGETRAARFPHHRPWHQARRTYPISNVFSKKNNSFLPGTRWIKLRLQIESSFRRNDSIYGRLIGLKQLLLPGGTKRCNNGRRDPLQRM